ncbi:MAG: alpha-E domain-containing protein [Sumerlaeia bacterium]
MLSRVAENIYWMARNVERAENIARIAEVNHLLTIDSVIEQKQQWEPLISIFAQEKNFKELYKKADAASVLNFLFTDLRNYNSVASCLHHARENARGVRDQISGDAWNQLNRLYLQSKAFVERKEIPTQHFFDEIKDGAHLFFGIVNDTMSHDEGYRWMNLGRFLERADKTSRVIDVKYFILLPNAMDVGTPLDVIQWMAVLKSVSASHMYWRVHPRIIPEEVVGFLLQNEEFPRSVYYCVKRARRELENIFGQSHPLHERFLLLEKNLQHNSINKILGNGLHEFIDEVQRQLNELHIEIYANHFSLESAS